MTERETADLFEKMADIWCDPESMDDVNKEWIRSLIGRWMALGFSPEQVRLIEAKYWEPFAQYDMCSEELLSFFERLFADKLISVNGVVK